jgi:hypothetical protein
MARSIMDPAAVRGMVALAALTAAPPMPARRRRPQAEHGRLLDEYPADAGLTLHGLGSAGP